MTPLPISTLQRWRGGTGLHISLKNLRRKKLASSSLAASTNQNV